MTLYTEQTSLGLGVFTDSFISEGTTFYVEPIIILKNLKDCLPEELLLAYQSITHGVVIIPTGLARFFNHKAPATAKYYIDSTNISFTAAVDIQQNEEIFINYASGDNINSDASSWFESKQYLDKIV